MMNSEQIKRADERFVMHTYGRFPVAITSGKGARVYSPEGREYIDFTSGIGVCSVGYGNERWAKAVYDQALKLAHISNLFYTEPCTKLAERLCAKSGMTRVFFSNSGAESNEGAIKLARKYSFDKYGEGRKRYRDPPQLLPRPDSDHPRRHGPGPFSRFLLPLHRGLPLRAEANDYAAMEAAAAGRRVRCDDGAGAGRGRRAAAGPGVRIPGRRALPRSGIFCSLSTRCRPVSAAPGPSSHFEHYGIRPDVVTTRQRHRRRAAPGGGAGGRSMCAMCSAREAMRSTFGANPMLYPRGAWRYIDILEEEALSDTWRRRGGICGRKSSRMKLPQVSEVRGKGLMLGVAVPKGASISRWLPSSSTRGLLAITAGADAIRFLPPLTITYEEIDAGLAIFESVLRENIE